MVLTRLSLKNFKGIRDFVLETGGRSVSVFADNARGKTTLADAFMWLLFGKDSLGRADFEIKTIVGGKAESGLEHEVEAVLLHEGQEITLRKVFAEKYTKKHGTTTKEFTGHTVTYYVDGVPKSERDYKAFVATLCPEETFRLLTDPRHFAERMKWQDRRRILLDVCGDLTDGQVIEATTALSGLPDILGKRTLDEHRAVIQMARKKINEELETIPARIAENERTISESKDLDPKTLASVNAHLENERRKLQEQLVRVESGGEIAQKTTEVREIESKIIGLRNKASAKNEEELRKLRRAETNAKAEVDKIQSAISLRTGTCNQYNSILQKLNTKILELREEWNRQNAVAFESSDLCPTCGQAIPEEKRKQAEAEFNGSKAERLRSISADGKATREELLGKQCEQEKIKIEILSFQGDLTKAEEALTQANEAVKAHNPQLPEEIAPLQQKKTELESAISELRLGSHDQVAEIKAGIEKLESEIKANQTLIAQVDSGDGARKRIDSLKRQQRELAAEYEELERQLNLTDEFVRSKVRLLEERINSRFELARFRLFDNQVNGGLSEACDVCTADGVPWNSMNDANRKNIGLDCIRTLSEHYGVTAPIFIDDAITVNELLQTKSQQIRLYVSRDKELRVVPDREPIKMAVNE